MQNAFATFISFHRQTEVPHQMKSEIKLIMTISKRKTLNKRISNKNRVMTKFL